jgi:hypothetical protein
LPLLEDFLALFFEEGDPFEDAFFLGPPVPRL